jgi:hypothetical protein
VSCWTFQINGISDVYQVVGDIVVDAGKTLTLAPGVRVRVGNNYTHLFVNGNLACDSHKATKAQSFINYFLLLKTKPPMVSKSNVAGSGIGGCVASMPKAELKGSSILWPLNV